MDFMKSVGEFVGSDCSTSLHPSLALIPLSPTSLLSTLLQPFTSPPTSLHISDTAMPSGDERHISLADSTYVTRDRDQTQTQHF
jgi:hypothetical protein